jgi:hypothetical protein
MRRSRSTFAAGAAVAVAGLTLSACFTANLSGNGKTGSVLQPGKSIELEIKSTDSLGTGLGSLSGRFKDAGANVAFPYGVSLSFRKGTTFGFGFSCAETTTTSSSTTPPTPPGPQRLVHARPAGGSPFGGLCSMPGTENARVWLGLVTYSSADKRVPNVTAPECAEAYYYYVHGGMLTGAPSSSKLASVKGRALRDPASKAITGFGELVIVDTNHDGVPGPTDGFGFATICGPYANLDSSVLPLGPVTQDCSASTLCPTDNYSYATCTDAAFGYGGVYPTAIAYEDGPMAVAEMLATECGDNIASGNLRIGIATDWGSGVSGPSGPPN